MSLDARSIACALGGDVAGRDKIAAPGPCHSRLDRSLTVWIRGGDITVHSHAGDDWRVCKDYVRDRLGIDRRDERQSDKPRSDITFAPAPPDPSKIAAAMRVWAQGVGAAGTPAEEYLANRGVDLPETECIRWHAPERAMLALFRNIVTDEPQAISRTFLDHEGRKDITRAPGGRKFLGPVKGAAIKLDADEDVLGGLHIGEGIETCLAAQKLGLRPVWALGSANAIGEFPILGGIECLSLLLEHDEANRKKSEACAKRWYDAKREVVLIEPKHGNDLNDAIRGAA